MVKVTMEADRDNMLGLLKAQDWWKDKVLESMCDEDLLEFGIKEGIWNRETLTK